MNVLTLPVVDFDIQESTASHLNQRVTELLDAINEVSSGRVLDASKNLLETVFRTIITDKNGCVREGRRAATLPELYAQAKECVSLSDEPEVIDKVSELCGKAVLIIGQLRNNYGFSSHGRDGYDTRQVGMFESLLVARVTLGVTNLFYGKHLNSPLLHMNARIRYEDFEAFNSYFDSSREDITIEGILIRPSEALFYADEIAYREHLVEYLGQPFDIEEGESL